MMLIVTVVMGIIVFAVLRIVIKTGVFSNEKEVENKVAYIPGDELSIKKIYNAKFLLDTKWEIIPDDFWISLKEEPISDEFAFDFDDFTGEFGLDNISAIVNEFETGKIFYFAGSFEYGIVDSMDLNKYPDSDVYYTNAAASWVVYRTYDNTIAFGGTDLIQAIKSNWNDYEKYLNPWDNIEEME